MAARSNRDVTDQGDLLENQDCEYFIIGVSPKELVTFLSERGILYENISLR